MISWLSGLSGMAFVKGFVALHVGWFVLVGFMMHRAARRGGGMEDGDEQRVDLYDIAYLRGGVRRVLETVVWRLHKRGAVEIQSSGRPKVTAHEPRDMTPIEQQTLAAIASRAKSMALRRALRDEVASLRRGLVHVRMLMEPATGRALKFILWIGLLVLGSAEVFRIVQGVVHSKPFGFTIAMMVVAVIIAWIMTGRRMLTLRGKQVMQAYRKEALRDVASLPETAWHVAIVGLGCVSYAGARQLGEALAGTKGSSTGSSWAAGCGAGCSAGSSGCGGGGCGGCGGCG